MKELIAVLLLMSPAWSEDKPDVSKLPGISDNVVGGNKLPEAPAGEKPAAQSPTALAAPTGPAANNAAGTVGKEPDPSIGANLPTEVVIKGSDSSRLKNLKPLLNIQSDPFESIRASLEPDENLLLAESPFTVSWRRTHPEFLASGRVIEPWRTTFSERPGIIFRVRDQLYETLQRVLDAKEAKDYQWSLTIADEEGRVFQHYEGSKEPPEELIWTGQNDQGEWIRAGRSYSAVYMFTDPGGSPHTRVGKPIQFTGIVHQESDGLHVSLDSTVLFGPNKAEKDMGKGGNALVRAAADLVKRRYSGIPVRVAVFASTREVAEQQAVVIQAYLLKELMMMPQHVSVQSDHAPFSEQRTELLLLNR